LSEYFDADVIGVDPSEKMLAQARSSYKGNARLTFILSDGENIPVSNNASMVFMSMVYHYFRDRKRIIPEIGRVLNDTGYVVVRNATRENILENRLFDLFPEAKKIETNRLLTSKEIEEDFTSSGFISLANTAVSQLFAATPEEYYTKISKKGLSVFNLISDEAFKAGMKRLKAYCGRLHENEPIYEPIHLLVFDRSAIV